MKVGRTRLTNTDAEILRLLRSLDGGLTTAVVVRHFYKTTKQPEKKVSTFSRKLRRLQRFGLVRETGGLWFDPAGGRPGGKRMRLAA